MLIYILIYSYLVQQHASLQHSQSHPQAHGLPFSQFSHAHFPEQQLQSSLQQLLDLFNFLPS